MQSITGQAFTYYSLKGGEGVSTTALIHAVEASKHGPTVLVAGDDDSLADLRGMASLTGIAGTEAANNLRIVDHAAVGSELVHSASTVIIDSGSRPLDELTAIPSARRLVTSNGYTALARMTRATRAENPADSIVVVLEPRRALGVSEVEAVAGVPVAFVLPRDPAIARAADAGTLAQRLPKAAQGVFA